MAADLNDLKQDLVRRMDGAIETLRKEFAGLRTGRASPGLLEPVRVEAYGTAVPITQVGTIGVPEPRLLTVQVWDRTLVGAVERAIRDSGLGLNPASDGQVVRVPIPQLTAERRNDLAKAAGRYGEGARIAVRGVRRDGMGVPLVCLIWLRGQPTVGAADVLFVLLVIWCGDIGAYVAGRWLGGPKLAPAISPGKTWSGAAGGLVASMLAGAATSAMFGGGSVTHLLFWVMPVAGVIGVAGQIGDLFESGVKRWAGVKDSGRSIPGHGGLLDRLDAVLTAGPVAALLAWWAGQGMSQGVYLWH